MICGVTVSQGKDTTFFVVQAFDRQQAWDLFRELFPEARIDIEAVETVLMHEFGGIAMLQVVG